MEAPEDAGGCVLFFLRPGKGELSKSGIEVETVCCCQPLAQDPASNWIVDGEECLVGINREEVEIQHLGLVGAPVAPGDLSEEVSNTLLEEGQCGQEPGAHHCGVESCFLELGGGFEQAVEFVGMGEAIYLGYLESSPKRYDGQAGTTPGVAVRAEWMVGHGPGDEVAECGSGAVRRAEFSVGLGTEVRHDGPCWAIGGNLVAFFEKRAEILVVASLQGGEQQVDVWRVGGGGRRCTGENAE